MTIEEKLQHFYTASIDSAMQEAQQVQTQHQEALDKIFQEHKETKERQIQSHIQAETDNLKREINKTVSARQLEYRRLLSDKTEEIKQQLFHDVAERLAQFRSTPEYLEYLSQRITARIPPMKASLDTTGAKPKRAASSGIQFWSAGSSLRRAPPPRRRYPMPRRSRRCRAPRSRNMRPLFTEAAFPRRRAIPHRRTPQRRSALLRR